MDRRPLHSLPPRRGIAEIAELVVAQLGRHALDLLGEDECAVVLALLGPARRIASTKDNRRALTEAVHVACHFGSRVLDP